MSISAETYFERAKIACDKVQDIVAEDFEAATRHDLVNLSNNQIQAASRYLEGNAEKEHVITAFEQFNQALLAFTFEKACETAEMIQTTAKDLGVSSSELIAQLQSS